MLAYDDRGTGDAIVLLHGIGADRRRWDPALSLLEDRYRCVAIDLPGHGESPNLGCDVGSAANAVHEVAERLGLVSPVVIGHSLGAAVALVYAAAFRPRSVVAVDPLALDLLGLSRDLAGLADRLRGDDWAAAFDEWEARIPAGPITDEQRAWMARCSRLSRGVLLSYWSAVLDPAQAGGAQELFSSVLAAIDVPVLVLLGARSSPGDAAMLALLGTATTELWDGVGHYPQIVAAQRFADRIAAWAGRDYGRNST